MYVLREIGREKERERERQRQRQRERQRETEKERKKERKRDIEGIERENAGDNSYLILRFYYNISITKKFKMYQPRRFISDIIQANREIIVVVLINCCSYIGGHIFLHI